MNNKLNLKLINILITLLIILVIYNMRFLIMGILSLVFNIISPMLISIMISYVLNLYLKKLNKIFNKYISIIIFILSITGFMYLFIFKMFPIIIEQVKTCISILVYIIKDLSMKYNISINNFDGMINFLSNFNILNIASSIFNYITLIMITISFSIYLFFDFNIIKEKLKNIIGNNTYLFCINKEIEKYTTSFFILVIISIIEYSLIFFIIGHPNYLFLGILAGILSLIPIIGGMVTNLIALTTAFVINYGLFIRTIIGILILSILDGYIICPMVYSKSNKISPLLTMLAIYVGSKLFGIMGSVLALPILIIFISIYKLKK
ncbi:MAG: AI-2E family transporter [Bacilli bacterium]|nr:AI-2E family transporter [Bacilli bacterium]